MEFISRVQETVPRVSEISLFSGQSRFLRSPSIRSLMTRLASRLLPALVVALLLTGCRTYGGRGSEEQLTAQLQQAHTQFVQMRDQARNDLAALQQQAASNPALGLHVAAFEANLQAHEALLQNHEAMMAHPSGGDYRDLSNAFGAMLTEHQKIADRYQAILRQVRGGPGPVADQSRYQIVPPYYVRVMEAQAAAAIPTVPAPNGAPDSTAADAPQAN